MKQGEYRKKKNVLAQLTNIGGLSSWSRAHVQHELSLLWRKSHDGQKTGGSLQHVLAGQVLWSRTCFKAEGKLHVTWVTQMFPDTNIKTRVRLLNGKRNVMTYWD